MQKLVITKNGVETVDLSTAEIAQRDADQIEFDAQVLAETEAAEREWRDAELARTDYTQIPDAPLTSAEVTAYSVYRQELRDMPSLTGFPLTHTRPVLA